MMLDIFSSFDPYVYNSYTPSFLFLILNMSLIFIIQSIYWVPFTRSCMLFLPLSIAIKNQMSRTYMSRLKGLVHLSVPLFFMIMFMNMFGLIPYTFSTTSHLIFTLSFGLPMWLGMIMSSFTMSPKASVAHFLPDGAPDWLNPFLVLIETTSIMVRPLTLSFRLAANMSAGHIVLSLVGIYCAAAWFNSISSTIMLLMISMGYILFEAAICLIQAYIFCLLLSLYSDDHAH